jgi:hypothetical protein
MQTKRISRYGTANSREGTSTDRDILTLSQTAALLQVHPLTLSEWRREGKGPPALNLAGSARALRFRRADVLKWAYAQKTKLQCDADAVSK